MTVHGDLARRVPPRPGALKTDVGSIKETWEQLVVALGRPADPS